MLIYCQLDHNKQNLVKFELKFEHFRLRKSIWKYCQQNGSNLASASIWTFTLINPVKTHANMFNFFPKYMY